MMTEDMTAVLITDVPLEYAWCAWCKMSSGESLQKLSEQLVVAGCEYEHIFTLGLCETHYKVLLGHVENRTLYCAGKEHPIVDTVSRQIQSHA